MRLFLQLALAVLVIAFGCQSQSEEEDSSSEENLSESEETEQNQDSNADSDSEEEENEIDAIQSRSDPSEKGFRTLKNNRGNQHELTRSSKKKGKSYDLEIEIRELREVLRDQSRWSDHLGTKIGELKEIQKNQNKWIENTELGLSELKGILEKQNSNKQLKTALQKLKEFGDNQNYLKNTFKNQNSSNDNEMKEMVQNQNKLLQNYATGRRTLTMLGKTIEVLTEPNGWIVIQSRFNGSVDFYRNIWTYRDGFGSLDGEFWLGLQIVYTLTSTKHYELLIQMEDYYGVMKFAHYKKFAIDGQYVRYRLTTLESYSGTAGDSLSYHRGAKFTTYDLDYDDRKISNCAEDHHGGWWYKDCFISNLNGLLRQKADLQSMTWNSFNNRAKCCNPLKFSKMMIREVK